MVSRKDTNAFAKHLALFHPNEQGDIENFNKWWRRRSRWTTTTWRRRRRKRWERSSRSSRRRRWGEEAKERKRIMILSPGWRCPCPTNCEVFLKRWQTWWPRPTGSGGSQGSPLSGAFFARWEGDLNISRRSSRIMEEQQATQRGGDSHQIERSSLYIWRRRIFGKWKFLELILLIVVSFIVSSW